MPRVPLSHFITLRTYGTWLGGDPRGSVDRRHSAYGAEFAPRDDWRQDYQRRAMAAEAITLTAAMRPVVERSIEELCQYRGWELRALNVRTNHVHVVVTAEQQAERVLGDLKAYATRALRRSGLVEAGRPVWAGHGSTVHCFTDSELERVVAYTNDEQGADLPGNTWPRRELPE